MAKLTKMDKPNDKCTLCGINLWVETDGEPDPKKAMPCGIDRTQITGSADGAGKRCPYETEGEQSRNFVTRKTEKAGEGQIWYEGGMTL
jgi:hypothetical protein